MSYSGGTAATAPESLVKAQLIHDLQEVAKVNPTQVAMNRLAIRLGLGETNDRASLRVVRDRLRELINALPKMEDRQEGLIMWEAIRDDEQSTVQERQERAADVRREGGVERWRRGPYKDLARELAQQVLGLPAGEEPSATPNEHDAVPPLTPGLLPEPPDSSSQRAGTKIWRRVLVPVALIAAAGLFLLALRPTGPGESVPVLRRAEPVEYPWAAALVERMDGRALPDRVVCTGVTIDELTVLASAMCVASNGDGVDVGDSVVVGRAFLGNASTGQRRQIASISEPGKQCSGSTFSSCGVARLTLNRPLTSFTRAPIRWATDTSMSDSTADFVTHSATELTARLSSTLVATTGLTDPGVDGFSERCRQIGIVVSTDGAIIGFGAFDPLLRECPAEGGFIGPPGPEAE